MLGDGVAQRPETGGHRRVDIGVLHEELHRAELPFTGRAHGPRHAGGDGHVGITGRVHEDPTGHSLRALFRGDHHGRDVTVVVAHDVGNECVQHQADAVRIRALGDQMVGQPLGGPRHVEQNRGVLERIRPEGGTSLHQLGGKRASETTRDLVERAGLGPDVQPAHGSHCRDSEVAAEESVAFQQRDRRPGSSGRERRAEPRRPATAHHHVGIEHDLGLARRHGECRPQRAHRTMPPRVMAMTSSARSISSSVMSPASSTSSRMLRPVFIDSLMISAVRS